MRPLFVGIDVGTQGARAVLADERGGAIATAEEPFPERLLQERQAGWSEQDPRDWFAATLRVLREVADKARSAGHDASCVRGISVTSTSGTVCAIDERGEPLGAAIMYDDTRSAEQARVVDEAGAVIADKLGYRFAPSFALPKIAWIHRHDPRRFERTRYFVSPTDFVIGQLTGELGITDATNALKAGFDLLDNRWPTFIETALELPLDRFPRVVASGTVVGSLRASVASDAHLTPRTPVAAGMTDGCACQVATGAVGLNQWSSTLGTTLVLKGVTKDLIRDPDGRLYCHRHPDGYWLPGGASSTGAGGVSRAFARDAIQAFDSLVLSRAPTRTLVYPLDRVGERFPFRHSEARGFEVPFAEDDVSGGNVGGDEATRYAAYLEGVGYVAQPGDAAMIGQHKQ